MPRRRVPKPKSQPALPDSLQYPDARRDNLMPKQYERKLQEAQYRIEQDMRRRARKQG